MAIYTQQRKQKILSSHHKPEENRVDEIREDPLESGTDDNAPSDRRALARQHPAAATGAPAALHLFSGPAFTFPAASPVPHQPDDAIVSIDDERLLAPHFSGWIPGEIAAGRGPLLARLVDGVPVSICFCARRSDVAAEAGLETAPSFRGRGYAARVTAAWAAEVRAGGRIPLYSTAWDNQASRSVARKLGLTAYACMWSLHGP